MIIKIRQVKISDWKAIKEIYNEWRTEKTYSVPETILSNSQAKKRTKQLIEEEINLIAEKNNIVVGLLESNIGKLPKTKHTLYANQITVLKNYRKQGVGKKLMQTFINIAKKQKIKMIYLHVVSTNKPAIKLYNRFGFKTTGSIKRQYKFGTCFVDNNIMCKLL